MARIRAEELAATMVGRPGVMAGIRPRGGPDPDRGATAMAGKTERRRSAGGEEALSWRSTEVANRLLLAEPIGGEVAASGRRRGGRAGWRLEMRQRGRQRAG